MFHGMTAAAPVDEAIFQLFSRKVWKCGESRWAEVCSSIPALGELDTARPSLTPHVLWELAGKDKVEPLSSL